MTTICISPFSHSPILLRALVYIGVDAVMLDNEHALIPEDELRAALAILDGNARAVVRPESTSVALAEHYWALGARSLLLPKVEDFNELAAIVARIRELAGREWTTHSVVPLLESRAALDRIEDLAQVENLGMVSIGPYDLAMDMGVDDLRNDPVLLDYLEDRIRAIDAVGLKLSLYMLPEWLPRLEPLPISQYNWGIHEVVGAFFGKHEKR